MEPGESVPSSHKNTESKAASAVVETVDLTGPETQESVVVVVVESDQQENSGPKTRPKKKIIVTNSASAAQAKASKAGSHPASAASAASAAVSNAEPDLVDVGDEAYPVAMQLQSRPHKNTKATPKRPVEESGDGNTPAQTSDSAKKQKGKGGSTVKETKPSITFSPSALSPTADTTKDSKSSLMGNSGLSLTWDSSFNLSGIASPVSKRTPLKSTKALDVQIPCPAFTPSDDAKLIQAIMHCGSDLRWIHKTVTFSRPFSVLEIADRWRYIFTSDEAKVSGSDVESAPMDFPWDQFDDKITVSLIHALQFDLPPEADFVEKFKHHYIPARPAAVIAEQYKRLASQFVMERRYYDAQMENQQVPEPERKILNSMAKMFKENHQTPSTRLFVPDSIFENGLPLSVIASEKEAMQQTPKVKSSEALELRDSAVASKLEKQLSSEGSEKINAVFRGSVLRYEMKGKMAVIGRSTKENKVDINVALEGPASTVSRKQAIICLKPDKVFIFKNIGRKPIVINGKPLEPEKQRKVSRASNLVEIGGMTFTFETFP